MLLKASRGAYPTASVHTQYLLLYKIDNFQNFSIVKSDKNVQ